MRWYSFDPFGHVPRELATVGALRGQADGHDVSIRSRSHRIIDPAEKLEAYRRRARAATAARTWLCCRDRADGGLGRTCL
jgi:hypothetical protein